MKPAPASAYAGFWRRAGAVLIDLFLFNVITSLLVLCIAFLQTGGTGMGARVNALLSPLHPLSVSLDVLFVLAMLFFWVRMQGTPGKRLLDCRVVDARSGRPLSPGQAIARLLGYVASAIPLGLGFFLIAWHPRHRGFHDLLAGTTVILDDESAKDIDQLMGELR